MIFYKPFTTPKAITFDLDDTLYDNGPIIRQAEHAMHQFFTDQHPEVAVLAKSVWQQTRAAAIVDDPRLASDMSELRKTIIHRVCRQAGYKENQAKQTADAGHELFYQSRSDFQLNKTIYSLLKTLANRCPIVAITNGNVDLQAIGLAEVFSASFNASLQYTKKPAPDMFNAALSHLQLPAHEVLHVGDNLIKDVAGAAAVGIQTAWYAIDRPMDLNQHEASILPTVQLHQLSDLLTLV